MAEQLTQEQQIQAQLTAKLPALEGKIRIQRARRMYVEAPREQFTEVFRLLTDEMEFSMLSAITGLDLGDRLGLIYHLARPSGIVMSLSTSVPREAPVIQSISGRFPAADHYEREMADLLGMQVQGLAQGSRYPLPDDWPAGQYPLRKDWKAENLPGGNPKEGSNG